MANNLLFPLTADGATLSDQMGVQPLMKGQVARYKLIESDQDDPSRTDAEGRYHLKKTPGYTMVGKKVIFDPVSGKSVTILNKSQSKSIKTPFGEISSTRPESIKFMSDKPIVEVQYDEPEKYAFMERANENIDNPFRRVRGIKARYYRMDARKKLANDLEKDGFEVEATQWVWKEATYNDLKACANYANSVRADLQIKTDYKNEEASLGFEMLKRELFALAKKDPHTVIKGSTKIDSKMRMQVMDAERLQIIMFTGSKSSNASMANTWFHNDQALTTICSVEPGQNKHEALLTFIAKDQKGKEHYQKMVGQLEKFLKPQ